MLHHHVILIDAGGQTGGQALVDQTLDNWPQDDRPSTTAVSLDSVSDDPAALDNASMAWLLLDDSLPNSNFYPLIGQLQDRHIPALITREAETEPIGTAFQDGVVIAPPDAPPLALASMIRALLSQNDTVRALKAEIEILRLHQGGLCDQMDKLDEELRLAAQLQREFLPEELPSIGQLSFTVLYRPAGYVSGDIYDVIRLDDKHVGFFIADAVGHGVPAALMTVYIKRSLKTIEYDADNPGAYHILSPDVTIGRLNEDLVKQQANKVRFATACYGIINTETMELSVARAGHPFPLILRADGSTEWLSPEGGLLGVFPEEEYEMSKARLRPGDRLLLYSDGFELAFPRVDVEGQDPHEIMHAAYAEAFKHLIDLPPAEALQDLTQRIDEQAGSLHQPDDLTALMIAVGDPTEETAPAPVLATTSG